MGIIKNYTFKYRKPKMALHINCPSCNWPYESTFPVDQNLISANSITSIKAVSNGSTSDFLNKSNQSVFQHNMYQLQYQPQAQIAPMDQEPFQLFGKKSSAS